FEDVMGVISSPSIADVFYLAMYPLLITGLILFFKRPINIRFKSLLDTAIVMISAFFIVWFPLIWHIVEPSQPDALSMIFSLFYIFLDLTILFIVLALIFNRNKKIFDLPIALISMGLFFLIFGIFKIILWNIKNTKGLNFLLTINTGSFHIRSFNYNHARRGTDLGGGNCGCNCNFKTDNILK
ncbi:MAG: hypothetical protein U1C19_06990, partial [Methanobacteriaceae archaeon]|nr:hypothetical protein [Methanobacteriaceae archaeon]